MSENISAEHILAIEWACEKLGRLFAIHSDRSDFESLAALFTEDGVYTRPSVPDVEIRGRDSIYQAFLERPPLEIKHLVSNCVVDVLSPDSAKGVSYITFLAAPRTEQALPLTAGSIHVGEFHDHYVLTPEGWKISERRGRLNLKT